MLNAVILERGFRGRTAQHELSRIIGIRDRLGAELAEKFHTHAAKFGAIFKTGVTVRRCAAR